MTWRQIVGLVGALLAIGGCVRATHVAAPKHRKAAPVDPWKLTCSDPNQVEPALLWNGRMGVRIGRDGTGCDGQGAALPFFRIDEYDPAGEEKIRPLANPLAMTTTANGERLDPRRSTAYSQGLNMRTGILTTTWTQPIRDGELTVESETAISPNDLDLVQRWRFESSVPVVVEQVDREGQQARRPVDPTHAGTADWVFHFDPGAVKSSLSPYVSYSAVARASTETWTKRWQTDIEIDGSAEDQRAVRSFLFYLRSAVPPDGRTSMSPFGLSNRQYNGHIFWDADMWVFPALAFIDPRAVASIPNYRVARESQAIRNFADSFGKTASVTVGITYPWESSVSGRETAVGDSQKEIHVTGDVAFSQALASALGLVPAARADEIVRRTRDFYLARSKPSPRGRVIEGVMSPDEYSIGNNDLFTNLLAQWAENGGSWTKPHFAETYYLPHDGKSLLTYDDDPVLAYKQAAAVLSIYPLQYPPAERDAKTLMRRFADKAIPDGPAMTDSIHSIIWARLGERQRAYAAWRAGWEPFTRVPLMLFSEKRAQVITYFTTGAAGSLQAVLYGFLGFRIDCAKEAGAAWAVPLRDGRRWLSIKPNLPREWKSVKFKNFTVLGRTYTLVVTPSATTVTASANLGD